MHTCNSAVNATVWNTYFFEKNLQGDVVAVYNESGTKLITYTYDAWGNFELAYCNGATQSTLYNPFGYRGYYYDADLGLYYLNSRYYDSETGRFISADSYVSTGQGLIGYNMFAYCGNNPINMRDPSGNWPRWITATVAAVAVGVAIVAAVVSAPVVATAAVTVAVVSTVAYVAQSHHYDKRKALNTNLPETPEDADKLKWRNSEPQSDENPNGGGPSAACHQNTSPNRSNVKYVSPDGHREFICDVSKNIVLDSRDIGTYNFCPSGTFVGDIGHFFVDILPWCFFGNDDDDPGPLANEIIRLFE